MGVRVSGCCSSRSLDLAGAEAVSFRVRASAAAREAVAVLEIEEGASLEMAVRLPPAWPLRPADVECRRKVPSLALPACMCVYNREQPHGWGKALHVRSWCMRASPPSPDSYGALSFWGGLVAQASCCNQE